MTLDVLVVDEDEDVLAVTEAFLQRQDGIAVQTEADPKRALERLLDGEGDAVVSDMGMPALGGLELCERLREGGRDIPFVIFSGRETDEITARDDDDRLTGVVQKRTGEEQYEELAAIVREAAD
jgi:CheY-like chemotaxis protein